VEAIARILHLTDVNRVRVFMGLANYCRRYVKGFSAMTKLLNMLLKMDQEWQWGDELKALGVVGVSGTLSYSVLLVSAYIL
jgi:hypothetical protein